LFLLLFFTKPLIFYQQLLSIITYLGLPTYQIRLKRRDFKEAGLASIKKEYYKNHKSKKCVCNPLNSNSTTLRIISLWQSLATLHSWLICWPFAS